MPHASHIPAMVAHGADQIMETAASIVSLRIPSHMPDREGVINEAALTICLDAVLGASKPPARPLHAAMQCFVQKGRENGLPFSEIMESIHVALKDAIAGRVDIEAEEAAKPPAQ